MSRTARVTDAEGVAGCILSGFDQYSTRFRDITRDARARFTAGAWQDVQDAARDRILLYRTAKNSVCSDIIAAPDPFDWQAVRRSFEQRLAGRRDAGIAATFYNGIFRQMAGDLPLDDRYAFVTADPVVTPVNPGAELVRIYAGSDLANLLAKMLEDTTLRVSFADLPAAAEKVAERLRADIPLLRGSPGIQLEVLVPVFYRNMGAYLIGRLLIGEHVIPLALALRHPDEGVEVDAVLWGENHLSIIFSFTRAYFMVDVDEPVSLVEYLQALLPEKKRGELYTSIGLHKHGKTEFVRGYRDHLRNSGDQFEIAEGIRGQVMMVFGLPSYQTVFKIIKDRFPATKTVSRDDVLAAYQLVKTHDRVGRMADTQEFYNFTFPRGRFDEALLEELLKVAGGSVVVTDDEVVIRHLYTERMMTPLNLYIGRCNEFQLRQVLRDYGAAIRELAAANIFPGDMLLKNFGVTRHGRVVFYDYDEICYLTDVNFRSMPASESGEAIAEPWFEVGEYDVFPEEFATFLFPDETMQSIFREHHADLLTAAGWIEIQAQVSEGQLMDVYPYPARDRLT